MIAAVKWFGVLLLSQSVGAYRGLRLLSERTGGCGWTNTPDQNCGWTKDGSCVTNTTAGAGGTAAYDLNIMPEDLDSCKAACEADADCVAVNYAHPSTGGSGGPGSTCIRAPLEEIGCGAESAARAPWRESFGSHIGKKSLKSCVAMSVAR